ncbi:ribosome small subunit-dependent GTPase A [Porphyromonadaceae bacterium W3.11]|nr:ribosome small subunit-dependent GTPase A [Porphyromonadaceae bacterium W3.11]
MNDQTGLVVQNTGSLYLVKVGKDFFSCKLKGNFKLNGIRTTNPVAVGDWVTFEMPSENSPEPVGWITQIQPRRNYIIRRSSNLSKQAHILGANLDRTLLVVTVNYPVTSTTFIDRYLATAQAYRVEAALVFNKIDRYDYREHRLLNKLIDLYESIGYRCFKVSAQEGDGIEEVKEYISHGISLISGHSGVGKSTFINALVPDACLRTQAISEAHNVGVHTTTFSEMIPFGDADDNAFLIDTPGIKGFGLIEFAKEEVGHYFPEIFKHSKDCYFNNCTHVHEPKCAVQLAVKAGEVAESRYKSYLSILKDDEDAKYRV